jgi:hypothetical protein
LLDKESLKINVLTLEDLKKIKIGYEDQEKKSTSLDKSILEIYKKLVELDDEDLFLFLKESAPTLIKIDRIDKYLRVVEETSPANKIEPSFDINTEEQLELLKSKKVTEFNKLVEQGNNLISLIHLPYENLNRLKLKDINLQHAFLFRTKLLNADLSYANLISANLSDAILVHNNYDQSVNKGTNFNNAVIDNPEYIKYLHIHGGQNIPDEIKSKQGLKSMLEKRDLDDYVVNQILSVSDLQ